MALDKADLEAISNAAAKQLDAALASLTKAITDQAAASATSLTERMGKALEPLAASLGEVGMAVKTVAAQSPLKAEDVASAMTTVLASAKAADAAKGQADAAVTAARKAFADGKLKDLPAIYRDLLPATSDAAALAAAEQDIRARFKADLAAAGVKPPDLGQAAPAAQSPLHSASMGNLTPQQMIQRGVEAAGMVLPSPSPSPSPARV
jgi:hypothetical protein